MKLQYRKKINAGKVIVTLNLSVSSTEFKAIRMIGEPRFDFRKSYPVSKSNIVIDTSLLQLKDYDVIFKSSNVNDIYNVAEEALIFIEDFKDYVEELVEDFVVEYNKLLNLQKTNNDTEKDYGLCGPDCESCAPSPKDEELCYCGEEYDNSLGIKIVKTVPCQLPNNKIVGILSDEEDD